MRHPVSHTGCLFLLAQRQRVWPVFWQFDVRQMIASLERRQRRNDVSIE
jgi:hypothetical protein